MFSFRTAGSAFESVTPGAEHEHRAMSGKKECAGTGGRRYVCTL
jgi:hypothetical protein